MTTVGRHGSGSIVRRSDGRLQVMVTKRDGERIFRYVPRDADRARQHRRAVRVLSELTKIRDRDLEPERQTLAEYLAAWLTGQRDGGRIARRTLDHYAYVVEDHIIPGLGRHQLDRLTERHIQAWLDGLTVGPRSAHHFRAVLRRALNSAIRSRLLAHNPAVNVELPTVPKYRGDPLTADETVRLLAAADARLAPLWRLAIVTGFRESELLGLWWSDLDLDAGVVTMRLQLLRADGDWHRVPTKAARSVETVAIDPGTVALLRRHRVSMAAERSADWKYASYVFLTPGGEPYGRSAVLRAFHDACDAAGIRRRRFHDLRGTSATLLSEAGIPEHVRQARLGHATTAMARHYAQVRDQLDRDAASALGSLLG